MSAEPHAPLLALLEDVKDHPDDDSRRLALADWMEQHGRDDAERARGRFIRLQCRRARLSPGDPLVGVLEAQEQALRREFLAAWLGDWQPWVTRLDTESHWFDRGLLRPWVTGLGWLALEAVPPDSAAWAWVDGLVVLDLSRAEEVARLAASPVLRGMTSLEFGPDSWDGNSEFGDAGAQALAASPHLTRLRSLELGDTDVGPEGFRALVQAPLLGRLTSLKLTGFDCTTSNHIGDEGALALAAATHMTGLSCLWLMENCIGRDGARALAGAAHLDSLTELDLGSNPVGPEGALALASSPFFSGLTALRVDVTASPNHSAGFRVNASEPELEQARAALRQRFGAAWRSAS
ncbi:MAG: TIGR02996 domain-containing protein [Isosphaeraceae bacterium]